jgi:ferredoxin
MIVVDKEACRACGQCVKICHEHCLALDNGALHIDRQYCSTCTQCIAICPRGALSWDGTPSVPFDRDQLPSPQQIDELLKQRRTIRFFKETPLDRALLQEIVRYGIYAPTNNYHLRAIVVDDPEMVAALDQVIIDVNKRIYNLAYRFRPLYALISRLWPNGDYVQARPKLETTLARGWTFGHQGATMVLIVGDKRTPLSEASAHYALYNMILYAQTKGVGNRLWGPGQLFLTRSRAARRRLGLSKQERIYGTLLLGWPAVKFKNKVQGKSLPIQWNGGQ